MAECCRGIWKFVELCNIELTVGRQRSEILYRKRAIGDPIIQWSRYSDCMWEFCILIKTDQSDCKSWRNLVKSYEDLALTVASTAVHTGWNGRRAGHGETATSPGWNDRKGQRSRIRSESTAKVVDETLVHRKKSHQIKTSGTLILVHIRKAKTSVASNTDYIHTYCN